MVGNLKSWDGLMGAGGAGDGAGSEGGRGGKWCHTGDFSRFLAVNQARMPRISAFPQWSGEIGRFLMTDENRDARPRCQSQRG